METFENERETLMKNLLNSVKQCQVNFGGKTVLASDVDERLSLTMKAEQCIKLIEGIKQGLFQGVSKLLENFENSFQHGLKKNKMIEVITSISEPIRQVTQKVLPESDTNFWPFIRQHLTQLDINHFHNLEDITTDSGRARVWLRTCINENSLERNLNTFFADRNSLSQFYESWALFRDEERANTLPTMARGLGSILFALNTKDVKLNRPFESIKREDPVLNFKTHRRVSSSPLPVIAGFDTEPAILKKINVKKRRKKKVTEARISDLDDDFAENSESNYSKSLVDETTDHEIPRNTSKSYANDSSIQQYLGNNTNNIRSITLINNDNSDTTDYTKTSNSAEIAPISLSSGDNLEDHVVNENSYTQSLSARLKMLQNQSADTGDKEIVNLKKDKDDREVKNLSVETLENKRSDSGNVSPDISDEKIHSSIKAKREFATPETNDTSLSTPESSTPSAERDSFSEDTPLNTNVISESFIPVTFINSTSSLQDITETSTLSSGESPSSAGDSVMLNYDDETFQAATDTLALLSATTNISTFQPHPALMENKQLEEVNLQSDALNVAPSASNHLSNLSKADLKQAVLATVKKKDEVEKKNKVLQEALEEQRELTNKIQNEYEALQKEVLAKDLAHKKKVQDMTKEIDVLKNQLKKYVAAVQTLRKDKQLTDEMTSAISKLRTTDDDITIPPKPIERSISENDSIFEEKLAQMAELHGELLELQEVLQKQLVSKDRDIQLMKQELISLRGPLPENLTQSDSKSSESLYVVHPTLINIWIPSVFLKGRGTEAYHLYQIYIRIADEEWNIYRRYSQFLKLHAQVSKLHSTLEKFDFPKKKMFGKKDLKFVEARRRKLQEYLRVLINTCISDKTELANRSSKLELTQALPFFSESYAGEDEKKSKKNDKKKKASLQYTGFVSFPVPTR